MNTSITTIVTHPGQAHRDEFLACCLILAAEPIVDPIIHRRDPTDGDFAFPGTCVLDQGGRLDDLNNMDHHQLERDHPACCSITLVIERMGISLEMARKIWLWLEFSEYLDSKGPFVTAQWLGMEPDKLISTVSPIETSVLRWFQDQNVIETGDELYTLMKRIGKEKLDYLEKVVERLEGLGSRVEFYISSGGFQVMTSHVDRDDDPYLGLELFCQQTGRDIAVTITADDRGDGYSLFRRNDDPRVDFSRIEGMPGVVFAHKSGFVAKVAKDADYVKLISEATVPVAVATE